jgi:PhnB protein
MKSVHPYLNFKGNTEEAFTFYQSVFGTEISMLVRFRDFGDDGMGVAEADLDRIAHVCLPLGSGSMLMATDSVGSLASSFNAGNNFYINLEAESADEAQRLFTALSDGGGVEMALGRTEWAELFGACADRFGVRWMVNYPGGVEFDTTARD